MKITSRDLSFLFAGNAIASVVPLTIQIIETIKLQRQIVEKESENNKLQEEIDFRKVYIRGLEEDFGTECELTINFGL